MLFDCACVLSYDVAGGVMVCFVDGCAMLLAYGWLVNGAVMFFGEAGYCRYHTVCIYGVGVTCVVMTCCGGLCG